MGHRGRLLAVAAILAGTLVGVSPAQADEEPAVTVVTGPSVTGTTRYGSTLTARPGSYDPADATTTIEWLRDGQATGATGTTYRLGTAAHGHRLAVRVTADAPGRSPVVVTSAQTAAVSWALLVNTKKPYVAGVRRYGQILTAKPGTWKGGTPSLTYRWLRDGKPIAGATGRRHRVQPGDVGHRISFRVRAKRAHHADLRVTSTSGGTVKHRRDIRWTVTYSVVKDGSSGSSLAVFARQAAETYADARGWRGAGVKLRRVSSGGSFTLVLAAASRVPRYSSECSARYSCRVGRYVIINEARWAGATRAWHRAHRSLRDYRHLVVNHETGHWFGKQHAGCSAAGRSAPVMMQQSKGLNGCKANPWPLVSELGLPRFS